MSYFDHSFYLCDTFEIIKLNTDGQIGSNLTTCMIVQIAKAAPIKLFWSYYYMIEHDAIIMEVQIESC